MLSLIHPALAQATGLDTVRDHSARARAESARQDPQPRPPRPSPPRAAHAAPRSLTPARPVSSRHLDLCVVLFERGLRPPITGTTEGTEMLHQRHYTAEQANDMLPVVRATVRRLQDAKRQLQDEGFDSGFATLADVVGGAYPGRARAEAAVAATLGFEQLEELDLLVRDLEAGPDRLPRPPGRSRGLPLLAGRRARRRSLARRRDRLPRPAPAGPLALSPAARTSRARSAAPRSAAAPPRSTRACVYGERSR